MINNSEDDASHFGSTISLPAFPKRTATPSGGGELEYCGSLDRRQRIRIARRWDRMHARHSRPLDANDSSPIDQEISGRKSEGLERNWSSNNSANGKSEARSLEAEGLAGSPEGSNKVDEGKLAADGDSERKKIKSPVRADFLSSEIDTSAGREARPALKGSRSLDSGTLAEYSQSREQSKEAVLGDADTAFASTFKRDDISRIGLRHSLPLKAKRKSQRKTPPFIDRLSASPLSFSGYEQAPGSHPNSLLNEDETIPSKEGVGPVADRGRRNRSESCEKDSLSENSVFSLYQTNDSGNESVVTNEIRGSYSDGDLLQDDRHKSLTAASSTDDGDDGIGTSPLVNCEKFDLQVPTNACVSKQEPTSADGTAVPVPRDDILSDTSAELMLSSSISFEGSSGKHKSSTDESVPEESVADDCVFGVEDEAVEEPKVLTEECFECSDAETMVSAEVSLADPNLSGSHGGKKSNSSESTLEGALLSSGVAGPGSEATWKTTDTQSRTLERADLFEDSFSEADKVSYGSIGVPSSGKLSASSLNVSQDQLNWNRPRRTASEADLLTDNLRSWGSVPVNQRIREWNNWGERLLEKKQDRSQRKMKRNRKVQSMYVDECDHLDVSSDPIHQSQDDSSCLVDNTNSISDNSKTPSYTQTVVVQVRRRSSSGSPTTPPSC